MRTIINITGQTMGNLTLLGSIQTYESEIIKTGFGNYAIIFKTKKSAKKALWEAYNYLRRKEPEFAKGGIKYSKTCYLKYDASTAKISNQ